MSASKIRFEKDTRGRPRPVEVKSGTKVAKAKSVPKKKGKKKESE